MSTIGSTVEPERFLKLNDSTHCCLQVERYLWQCVWQHGGPTGHYHNLEHVLAVVGSLVQLLHHFDPLHGVALYLLGKGRGGEGRGGEGRGGEGRGGEGRGGEGRGGEGKVKDIKN